MPRPIKDISGLRSGRVVAVRFLETRKDGKGKTAAWWECKCDCGTLVPIKLPNLRPGHTTSCGCTRWKRQVKQVGTV